MRTAIKRTVSAILTAAVMTSAIPFKELGLPQFDFSTVASAASVIDSGTCGENATWTFFDGGTLYIEGSGEMWDYTTYSSGYAPWNPYTSNIEKIVVNGVTSIGKNAFYKCHSAKTVELSNSVTSLDEYAFYNCSALTEITIPESVISIGDNAFDWCTSLTSISLPGNTTSIGNSVFYGCRSLESISIPSNITSIGTHAFDQCSSLKSITIPQSVTSIGVCAFDNCTELSGIYVSSDNNSYCDIDGVLFSIDRKRLIAFPAGKEGNYTVPNGVLSIENRAFEYCRKLTGISFPESIQKIDTYAFYCCEGLTEVITPGNIITIGDGAFKYCKNLKTIILSDSVKNIETSAFAYCTSLTELVLPHNLETIGRLAFQACTGLKRITIPENVKSIEVAAFQQCSSLSSVEISDGVTSIESGAFSYCSALTSIKIPTSVTSIASDAFSDSKNVSHIHISSEKTAVEYAGKYGLPSNQSYYCYDDMCYDSSCPFNTGYKVNKPVDPSTINSNVGTNNPYEPETCPNNVLTSAVIKYDLEEITSNLVNTYFKYHLVKDKEDADKHFFQIVCTPVDKDNVLRYEFYKGTELIATSSTDTITVYDNWLSNYDIIVDGDVFINVVDKNNVSRKTKLKLDIAYSLEGLMETELTLYSEKGPSVSIPSNVPFIGNSELDMSLNPIPAFAVVKPDGTVRIGINLIDKDLFDDDSSWDIYTNIIDQEIEYNKKGEFRQNALHAKNLKQLKKFVKDVDSTGCKLFSAKDKFNFTIAGYAETKIENLENGYATVKVIIGFEYEGKFSWQTFFVSIPIVVEGKASANLKVTGDVKSTLTSEGVKFSGELLLDVTFTIELTGGIGVAKVASVSVGGGGSISSRTVLLSSTKRHGFEKVDATTYGKIVVKAFFWKYEKKFAEKTYHIYSRDDNTSVAYINQLMLSGIYDQDNYVLAYDDSSEEYFLNALGSTENNNTVVSGLLCNASPEIISTDYGMLMTYISDDIERGTANATVLKYMFFSNDTQTWTEAQQLDNNSMLDWYSKLYSFSGKTYIIYSQADRIFNEEPTVEEMLSTMKITVAEYDAETNSFINFTDISAADGRYNSMPEFAVIGEKLAAVWVNGSAEDMFNQNSDNSVMYSIYDNGTWSTATTAATNLNTVTSVIAGDIGDETYFCVCTDSDCDLSTTGDSQIILIDSTGAQTVVAQGNVDNVQFAKLPCAENEVFIWYEDGDIKYAASPDETVSLFGESGFTVSNNFIVSDDRILFAFGETEEGSVVYQTVYSDGSWSVPITVEEADGNISSFAADNGILIYADTILTSAEDDSDIIDSTSIDIARYLDKYDIVLEAVDFDYTQIKPGQEMDIVLYVTNNTDTALENIDVTIGTVETSAECSILPGETGEVTVKYIVESVVDDSAITATVSGAKADTNPENNSVQFNFGKTEFSLSVTNRIIDNKSYYVAAITNESNISSGCTLTVTNEAGEEIYTKIIENVPANDTFYHMIKLDDLGCGEKDTLTSEVIADKEEYFTNNNISHEYVAQMDEYLPYVIVAFVDENGTEIARNAYALGDEITAPALPEGMTTWFEYGNPDPKPVSSFDAIKHDAVYVAVHPVAEVEQPVATSISYGQSLSNSLLSTGWSWTDDTIIPDVENEGFAAAKALTDDTIYDYSGVGESFVYDADAHTLTTTVSVNVKPATPSDNTEKTQSISCGSAKINKPQFNGINQEALDGTVSYTYNNEALTYDKLIDRLNEVVDVEEVSVAYSFVPDSSNYSSADGEIVVMISDSLKVLGHSLILSDDIGVTFYMQIPEVFAVNKNAAFKYNVGGTEEKTLSVADAEYTEKGYRFTCNVAPAELTETINAQVVCGDYESEVYTYSAVTYANQVLDNPSVYQDTIPLVKAILNYGTQAQVYFNHNTENLANSILEENDKALSPITADELKNCKYKVADNDKNIDFIGQVIQLKNKVIAKYYFSGDIDPKMCKVNGEQIAAENLCEDENGTYIAIRNIAPDDYDKPFVITVGNVTISNASVFSYLYTALSEEHTELYDIAYSMYAYNKAVEAYIA